MSKDIVTHASKEFLNINYSERKLHQREFYKCTFRNCNFTKSDLRSNTFEDCVFENCNFTMAIVDGVRFKNALFKESKLMGIDFSQCNSFMFSFCFEECQMDYSTFYGTTLKNTRFFKCRLTETDFTEADLKAAVFDQSDLSGTRFHHTDLQKADFRTALNFSIDPDVNKMKKAKFSAFYLGGLLSKYDLDIDFDK
ncbi:MAG: pentapeptide repeat-containing protein [Chryseobacterium taeanense]